MLPSPQPEVEITQRTMVVMCSLILKGIVHSLQQ
jgi:hypothetical protein